MKKVSSILVSLLLVLTMTMSVFAHQTMDAVTYNAGKNAVKSYTFDLNGDMPVATIPIKITETGKLSLTCAVKGVEEATFNVMLSKEFDYAKALNESEFDEQLKKGAQSFSQVTTEKADAVYECRASYYVTKGQTTYLHLYNSTKSKGKLIFAFSGSIEKSKVGKVSGLKVKNKKGKKAVVSWKKASNAKKYTVMYGTKKSFKGAKKKTVSGTKVTIKKLKKKKTYFFKVRGVNGSKTGAWSAVKKVKIKK